MREIKLLIAARAHPNVVALREVVVSANEGSKSVYLVLELVETDLKALNRADTNPNPNPNPHWI